MNLVLSLITLTVAPVWANHDPHFMNNRQGIVHLFEWKWLDIAKECEDFLGPKGYGGVQTSPVNENAIIPGRPWYERYQPISYKLTTRSGNEEEFREMVERCRISGVRIYPDVVVNHMAAAAATGTAGSKGSNPGRRFFPAVPYNSLHFHRQCSIQNYNNATEVRNCDLVGLPDLDQSNSYVRQKIVTFMNKLIDLGVAGFRMDACKHMSPTDLRYIYSKLKPLSAENGFVNGVRPFLFQEVIDSGNEGVRKQEYTSFGTVTEFAYSSVIGETFRKINSAGLSALQKWGFPYRGFLPSIYSFVFVDNHDNQREATSDGLVLTYKQQGLYIKAVVFMLAHPHGENRPRIMSSFEFSDSVQGPPQDSEENIISPEFDDQNQCTNGWVCEHRWAPIANMIKFRAATQGTLVKAFTNIAENQISFCRGLKGFIAINNSEEDLDSTLRACVPDGQYCDVISGDLVNGSCTGTVVTVETGNAAINIPADSVGIVAIHVNAKLPN